MLTGKRHGLYVGHAALVLFAFPLGISFCSLLLFLPLAGLTAALVAAIRLCLNLVETPALGEPLFLRFQGEAKQSRQETA